MSNPTSILPSLENESKQPAGPNEVHRKILVATFVSAILPGVGQFLLGRRRNGTALLTLLFALLSICWPLRFLTHMEGFLILGIGMFTLCIFATVNAAYGGRSQTVRPSQWWLVVLLPFALGMAAIHANWASRVGGFQIFIVPSSSMEKTVLLDSRVMVDTWYYRTNAPARGDIAVFLDPRGFYLVKRIIALSGETIRSSNGVIFINDVPISEPYVIRLGGAPVDMNNFGPVKIPAGRFFAMGDNRDVSIDSRSPKVGPLDVFCLRGRALYTIGDFHRTYRVLQ